MSFLITRDVIDNGAAAGTIGPRNISLERTQKLQAGEGEDFRLLDDDGIVYYYGRYLGNGSGFQPLYDFGTPNAGCTEIQYKEAGKWRTL